MPRRRDGELLSEGTVPGSLQVPTNGRPTLFLADHPITGGYPVIAVVVSSDIGAAAQARPGQRIRFRPFRRDPPRNAASVAASYDRRDESTSRRTTPCPASSSGSEC
ncbi:MAG: hypothetical protein J2P19_14545 [Pseudonocardia sp.]|nr:hypothetical protein [Pseudonocardia sp.]